MLAIGSMDKGNMIEPRRRKQQVKTDNQQFMKCESERKGSGRIGSPD